MVLGEVPNTVYRRLLWEGEATSVLGLDDVRAEEAEEQNASDLLR